MRKPRQVWMPEERAEIERKAQTTLELFAEGGDYVSYETCVMMAEMGYVQKKLDEIKQWLQCPG